MGKHEYRYRDGAEWTDQVASHGRQSTSPIVGDPKAVERAQSSDSVRAQVARHEKQLERRGAPPPPVRHSIGQPPPPLQDSVGVPATCGATPLAATGGMLDGA